jgi:hypothetical protein
MASYGVSGTLTLQHEACLGQPLPGAGQCIAGYNQWTGSTRQVATMESSEVKFKK